MLVLLWKVIVIIGSMSVCDMGSLLSGPFIIRGHLTGHICLQVLQDELLPLLDSDLW